jgi:hypothetical protein
MFLFFVSYPCVIACERFWPPCDSQLVRLKLWNKSAAMHIRSAYHSFFRNQAFSHSIIKQFCMAVLPSNANQNVGVKPEDSVQDRVRESEHHRSIKANER